MTVAVGQALYSLGGAPCLGSGVQWSEEELHDAIEGPIAVVLFDDEGNANIKDILASLAETQFAQEGLRRVLEGPAEVEDWRVGEAIAETYLTDHRSCYFPWPDGRDERKSGSSLPGADLVGFGADRDGDCLAFGEVKTSSDRRCPPRAMYGPTGLKKQLEDLRDSESIRDNLLKYLTHRATDAPWREQLENAGKRYLNDKSDVQLFGFLVRDVDPDEDDLTARVSALAGDRPPATRIELLALYLPDGSIAGIGDRVVAIRAGTGQ